MWNNSNPAVYLNEPLEIREIQSIMNFYLTFEGEVPSGRGGVAEAKHKIRKAFHVQLKRLWETHDALANVERLESAFGQGGANPILSGIDGGRADNKKLPLSDWVARQYVENGYRFAPLVRKDEHLLCSLQILLLRSDGHNRVVSAGDLDNRVKTIIDGLKRPGNASELGGFDQPSEGEDPFYVLLEDDDLVSGLTVETGDLLAPNDNNDYRKQRWCKVVISVDIKPYRLTWNSISFLG